MNELTPLDLVTIDLGDGKPRELKYTFASIRGLKKKFGSSLLSAETLSKLDEDTLPELIFAGLVEKNGLTADSVAAMLDPRRTLYVVQQFVAAFTPKNDPSVTETIPATLLN